MVVRLLVIRLILLCCIPLFTANNATSQSIKDNPGHRQPMPCDFIASTNIGKIAGYDAWRCSEDGIPITTPCQKLPSNPSKFTPVWPGVKGCDKSGRIKQLSLSGLRITGSLPSMGFYNVQKGDVGGESTMIDGVSHPTSKVGLVGHLSHWNSITYLDLSKNRLHGVVPSTLLAALTTSFKKRTGKQTSSDGADVGGNGAEWDHPNTSNLFEKDVTYGSAPFSYFDLSFNSFNGAIFESIEQLTQLKALDASCRDSTSSDKDKPQLESLKFLSLANNSFTGSVHGLFSQQAFLSLNHIDLDHNPFVGELVKPTSAHLAVGGGSDQPVVKRLTLANFSRLKYLSISSTHIHGPIPGLLLQHLDKLQYLRLRANRLDGQFPWGAIRKLQRLIHLDVNDNGGLEGPLENKDDDLFGLYESDGSVQKATSSQHLKFVGLRGNKFAGSIPTDFAYHLASSAHVLLSNNLLTGMVPHQLCDRNLSFLGLTPNPHLRCFPSCLSTLSSKSRLFGKLSYCPDQLDSFPCELIASTNISDVPRFSSHWKCNAAGKPVSPLCNGVTPIWPGLGSKCSSKGEILTLSLSGLQIFGVIPSSLSLLTSLQHLDISGNKFFGKLPHKLPQSLTYLDLKSNHLHGRVLGLIEKSRSLVFISVENNHFSGSFPAGFSPTTSFVSQLKHLNLHRNLFSGSLPLHFGEWNSLTYLSLGLNKFESSLPTSLGKLSQLIYLRLSYNSLSGIVPSTLSNLLFLTYINLSYNRFHGSLPGFIGYMPKLWYVGLEYNRFSGTIPTALGHLPVGRRFYFSSNPLVGKVPSELCNAKIFQIWSLLNDQRMHCYADCLSMVEFKYFGSLPKCPNKEDMVVCDLIAATNIAYLPGFSDDWSCSSLGFYGRGVPPCSGSKPMWEGVAGCTMDGHITHLNLKSIGLAGTLPESIQLLSPWLIKLDISNNFMYSSISTSTLFQLSNSAHLTFMDLRNNNFAVPDEASSRADFERMLFLNSAGEPVMEGQGSGRVSLEGELQEQEDGVGGESMVILDGLRHAQ